MKAEVLQHHHSCLIFVYAFRDHAVSSCDIASHGELLFGGYPTLSPTFLTIPSIFVLFASLCDDCMFPSKVPANI